MNSTNANILKPVISLKHMRRNNDPLGDAITRIRNGYTRSFDSVIVPKSNKILHLLNTLIRSGYILHYESFLEGAASVKVYLKYHNSLPAIQNIQRVSVPSKRVYLSKKKLKQHSKTQGWGLTKTMVLSTSSGVLTHQEILKSSNSMGGESICLVW